MNQKAYSNKQLIGMKYIGCWIDPELHQKLKALAESDERSLSAFIKKHLEKLVKSSS